MDNQPIHDNKPISIGEWFVTILITAIPLVGLIMLFVWGFSSSTPVTKANWAKAMLIWMLVAIVLGIMFTFLGVLAAVGASGGGY